MKITGIRRMSAAEEAFKALHDMIMSGSIKHGERLPAQDELARQFGISRNTVREAVNKLTVMGLLKSKQGAGTTVNIPSPSAYMASISDHLLLQSGTVRDFLEARLILERATVRLALANADRRMVEALEVNAVEQKEALRKGNVDVFISLDLGFHLILSKASGNTVIQHFLGAVTDFLGPFIKEVALLPRATHNAYAFHKDILKLVRLRNAEDAERKIAEHLADVARNIERNTGKEFGMSFPFGTV